MKKINFIHKMEFQTFFKIIQNFKKFHMWRFFFWLVYVVGTLQNRLVEAILMSTHNICFYGEPTIKNYPLIIIKTHLNCSIAYHPRISKCSHTKLLWVCTESFISLTLIHVKQVARRATIAHLSPVCQGQSAPKPHAAFPPPQWCYT